MARVTVEDCIRRVPNRFQLVMLAAQRAREVSSGAVVTVKPDDNKRPVVSLREIAEGDIDLGIVEENLIRGLQRHNHFTEDEDEADIVIGDDYDGAGDAGSEIDSLVGTVFREEEDAELVAVEEDLEAQEELDDFSNEIILDRLESDSV